ILTLLKLHAPVLAGARHDDPDARQLTRVQLDDAALIRAEPDRAGAVHDEVHDVAHLRQHEAGSETRRDTGDEDDTRHTRAADAVDDRAFAPATELVAVAPRRELRSERLPDAH